MTTRSSIKRYAVITVWAWLCSRLQSPPINALLIFSALFFPSHSSVREPASMAQPDVIISATLALSSLSATKGKRLPVLRTLMVAECTQWNTSRSIHLFRDALRNCCSFLNVYNWWISVPWEMRFWRSRLYTCSEWNIWGVYVPVVHPP
jgi:hypothetical protein